LKVSKFKVALLTTLCYGVFLVWSLFDYKTYVVNTAIRYALGGIPLHNLDHIQYRDQWYGKVATFGALALAIIWVFVFNCLQSVGEPSLSLVGNTISQCKKGEIKDE